MARTFPARLVAAGIGAFVTAAAVAPWLSHPDYSSVAHTTSELAGQNMPNAWIMRAGFIGFGGGTALAALWRRRSMPAVAAALLLFGLCMVAAAIWSHLPIDPALGGNHDEDSAHSVAASAMGAAFAAAVALHWWQTRGAQRWLDAIALAAATLLPMAMLALPAVDGALQRLMFAISFVWIWQVLARD
jgi:Protein of unknown function (DUF998)